MKMNVFGNWVQVGAVMGCLAAGGMLGAEEPAGEEAGSAPAPAFFARVIGAGEVTDNVFRSEWTKLGWTDRIAWEPGAQRVEVPDGVGVPIVISPYYPPHVTPTFLIAMDREVTIGHMNYGLRKNVDFTLQGPHAIRVDAGEGAARWSIGEQHRALRFMLHCELKLDGDLYIKFNAQRDGELVGGTSGKGHLTIDISEARFSGAAAFHQYRVGREGAVLAHRGGTTLIGNGTDAERGNRFVARVAQAFGGEDHDLVLQDALLDPGGFEHRLRGLVLNGQRIEPGVVVDSSHEAIVGEGRIHVVGTPETSGE